MSIVCPAEANDSLRNIKNIYSIDMPHLRPMVGRDSGRILQKMGQKLKERIQEIISEFKREDKEEMEKLLSRTSVYIERLSRIKLQQDERETLNDYCILLYDLLQGVSFRFDGKEIDRLFPLLQGIYRDIVYISITTEPLWKDIVRVMAYAFDMPDLEYRLHGETGFRSVGGCHFDDREFKTVGDVVESGTIEENKLIGRLDGKEQSVLKGAKRLIELLQDKKYKILVMLSPYSKYNDIRGVVIHELSHAIFDLLREDDKKRISAMLSETPGYENDLEFLRKAGYNIDKPLYDNVKEVLGLMLERGIEDDMLEQKTELLLKKHGFLDIPVFVGLHAQEIVSLMWGPEDEIATGAPVLPSNFFIRKFLTKTITITLLALFRPGLSGAQEAVEHNAAFFNSLDSAYAEVLKNSGNYYEADLNRMKGFFRDVMNDAEDMLFDLRFKGAKKIYMLAVDTSDSSTEYTYPDVDTLWIARDFIKKASCLRPDELRHLVHMVYMHARIHKESEGNKGFAMFLKQYPNLYEGMTEVFTELAVIKKLYLDQHIRPIQFEVRANHYIDAKDIAWFLMRMVGYDTFRKAYAVDVVFLEKALEKQGLDLDMFEQYSDQTVSKEKKAAILRKILTAAQKKNSMLVKKIEIDESSYKFLRFFRRRLSRVLRVSPKKLLQMKSTARNL